MAKPLPQEPTPYYYQESDPSLIAKELSTLIKQFINHVRSLIDNPGLVEDSSHLDRMVSCIKLLEAPSKAAHSTKNNGTCFCEDLKDAGNILQNILTQQLSIEPRSENPSLLIAAVNFSEAEAPSSDFRQIVLNFLHYPHQTEVLLKELHLILLDLTHV